MSDEHPIALRARVTTAVTPGSDRLMYMPAGKQQIVCGLGDEAAAAVTVEVGPETAAVLQASFAAVSAKIAPQRVLFDKEHESKEAMAWPTGFAWATAPQPGVYASVEFSSLGREFVEGRVMRAFSPSFFTDADLPKRREIRKGQLYEPGAGKRGSAGNPARITGLDYPYAGTLTNNPAFKEILPLWAKSAGATSANEKPKTERKSMPEQTMTLQEQKEALEQEIATLKASDQTMEAGEALKAKQAELDAVNRGLEAEALRAKNSQLEQALLAQREKDADGAVQAAIRRGALPAKDEALQAKWKGWCVNDPEMLTALNAMKGNVALQPGRLTITPVRIAREDSQSVLRAFDTERDPARRARIYKSEILTRLKEGDDLPLKGATITTGTLAGSLVTQRTLELLKFQFPALSRIVTDFSSEGARQGQTVITRYTDVPTVVAFESGGAGTGWTAQDWTVTDVPIALDQHKGVEITVDQPDIGGTVRRLFDEMAPGQSYAMAKDMVDYVYALITTAFTNTAVSAAEIDFGRAKVIDMAVAQTLAGVPQGAANRTLLLYPTYYGALAKDTAIVALATQQQPGIITGGMLPDVHGYMVVEAANLPNTSSLKGFGFSKSALCLAARPDNDYVNTIAGASNGNAQVISDPDIGISVLQVQYVNHQMSATSQRLSWVYGAARGQIAAGQRLTT